MKNWTYLMLAIVMVVLMNGCAFVLLPEESAELEYEPSYRVDAYVSIPDEVKRLIAGRVDGYSMPQISRYSKVIYPATSYNPYNLPSYVQADFNGDGWDDYAYMFSRVEWSADSWFLKTKMLIVASTRYGYEIASEIVLGTVRGDRWRQVEEYWGIRLLKKGSHTITTYSVGEEKEETIVLYNDGIYLASLDPDERSVFYVQGTNAHEIVMDLGAIAKTKAGGTVNRAERVIELK
ncbi:MAG: hypothetical protein GX640_15530 [Fibrobacter sp.]|nr:hypothetical protein [Fibrobacter sp.]